MFLGAPHLGFAPKVLRRILVFPVFSVKFIFGFLYTYTYNIAWAQEENQPIFDTFFTWRHLS